MVPLKSHLHFFKLILAHIIQIIICVLRDQKYPGGNNQGRGRPISCYATDIYLKITVLHNEIL
jgi:hypothetical protein